MTIFLFIAALVAMLAVVGVMVMGMVAMTRGGSFNEKYGNKLMQARVYLQGLALLLLALAYFSAQG